MHVQPLLILFAHSLTSLSRSCKLLFAPVILLVLLKPTPIIFSGAFVGANIYHIIYNIFRKGASSGLLYDLIYTYARKDGLKR